MNIEEEIKEITEKNISDKEKVDLLLMLDAKITMQIDKNSTKTDKQKRKVESRKVYRAIKPYDEDTYNLLIKYD